MHSNRRLAVLATALLALFLSDAHGQRQPAPPPAEAPALSDPAEVEAGEIVARAIDALGGSAALERSLDSRARYRMKLAAPSQVEYVLEVEARRDGARRVTQRLGRASQVLATNGTEFWMTSFAEEVIDMPTKFQRNLRLETELDRLLLRHEELGFRARAVRAVRGEEGSDASVVFERSGQASAPTPPGKPSDEQTADQSTTAKPLGPTEYEFTFDAKSGLVREIRFRTEPVRGGKAIETTILLKDHRRLGPALVAHRLEYLQGTSPLFTLTIESCEHGVTLSDLRFTRPPGR